MQTNIHTVVREKPVNITHHALCEVSGGYGSKFVQPFRTDRGKRRGVDRHDEESFNRNIKIAKKCELYTDFIQEIGEIRYMV